MWRITWRDLLFRRRRFLLAGVATSLTFAVALLLGGVVVAVNNQNARVVHRFEADRWWVPAGAGGPFTAGPVVPESLADDLLEVPGIESAEPVILLRTTLSDDDDPGHITDVNLVGTPIGGLGQPPVVEGRRVERTGEVVVDRSLGYDVGDEVDTGGHRFEVVGVSKGTSYLFAVPTMFLALRDSQVVGAGGQRAASAIVTRGEPRGPMPSDLVGFEDAAVLRDLNRVIGKGLSAVETVRAIMLVAAVAVVALIIYLSALERVRDVAVLKVSGASNAFIALGLAAQGLLITVPATLIAYAVAPLLQPLFPLELELTRGVHVQLGLIALAVGLLASLAGVRRVLTVDPAEAFG